MASAHPIGDSRIKNSLYMTQFQPNNKKLLSAKTIPVWFMRQAGRSLPEYCEIRSKISMLDACFNPEVCTEITLQPVVRHKVDAAIFFSDIVVPLKAVGLEVEIKPGVGPVFNTPLDSYAAVAKLPNPETMDLSEIKAAVGLCIKELKKPLIGFAAAPFTLASYLIEGKPSKDLLKTRAVMISEPELWEKIMTWVVKVCGKFLITQLLAGAAAGQIFDSWAGYLSVFDYKNLVFPYTLAMLSDIKIALKAAGLSLPLTHFALVQTNFLPQIAKLPIQAISVDYRTKLAEARNLVANQLVLQGNLDPARLFSPWEELTAWVREIIKQGVKAPGYIFNLGHGVPATITPDRLTDLVSFIHELHV